VSRCGISDAELVSLPPDLKWVVLVFVELSDNFSVTGFIQGDWSWLLFCNVREGHQAWPLFFFV
jgi:hypothetical protein